MRNAGRQAGRQTDRQANKIQPDPSFTRPPANRQSLLFSATMPEEIEALAKEILDQPVQIRVGKVISHKEQQEEE